MMMQLAGPGRPARTTRRFPATSKTSTNSSAPRLSAGPTKGRLTSFFGIRKFPLDAYDENGVEDHAEEFHRGIDIANHEGTPVQATADGVVRIASWQGGYGRLVVIDHGRGYRTYYAHNSQLLVKPGESVKRGQVISYMGTSGMSTGFHLHYEVWHNGQALNPMAFVKADDVQQQPQ